jgi:putative peptide zinc metalloprotease protein
MQSVFSPSWYRVAGLKPRLRGHAHIRRHDYRGEVWYVLQDHASGRYYRFTPEVYQVIGQMDGERTVQELWENAAGRLGDDAPTQGEMIQLLSNLHNADVLLCDVPPDSVELLRRADRVQRARWTQNLRSPMAMRFPLVDPEKFLARTIGLVRPFLTVYGALLWLAVVGTAGVLVGMHWSELTENVVDRVFSAQNLVVLLLAYPFVKIVHELGHGYMAKAWGGEVHEMGIMLIVLMPIPYVDASAASEFRSTHRRVLVGAAGIIVELFLASLAVFFWLSLDQGVLRSVAYNVILIGSVSTILFNGNPLLRYDGYYVLADILEIPNLAQRGAQYLGYLVKRFPLAIKKEIPPYTGPGEPFWLVFYTVTSFLYRIFIYTAIILVIAGKFFFIGVLLALWSAFSLVVAPIYRGLRFLVANPALRESRPRALALTALVLAILVPLLFVIPFPCRTRAEGVVWVPEESLARAGTAGFADRVVAPPDSMVRKDQLLVVCRDPLLDSQVKVLQARLEEQLARYDAANATDKVEVQVVREEIASTRAELTRAQERFQELEVRSPSDGRWILPNAQDLPGRYLKQGDLVGYVLEIDRPTVRVVVPQSTVDLVRQRCRRVDVRMVEQVAPVQQAVIRREVPGGLERLPSTVLGRSGGGEIATDPRDTQGTKAFEKMFQFDLELTRPLDRVFVGGRVYVRFDHGPEPLAFQWYRQIRQMFLRRFNV